MSTPQIPEPKLVGSDDDIEQSGRDDIWGTRSHVYPSRPIPEVVNADWSWSSNPSKILSPIPLETPEVSGGGHPQESDPYLLPIPHGTNNLQMLMPRTPPGPLEESYGSMSDSVAHVLNGNGSSTCYPWRPPPTPRLKTIPLPPAGPWKNDGDDGGQGNEGCNNRHSARQSTDILTQEVASMNLEGNA